MHEKKHATNLSSRYTNTTQAAGTQCAIYVFAPQSRKLILRQRQNNTSEKMFFIYAFHVV